MIDEVAWIIPGHILCVQFSGILNRDQIHQMNQRCIDLLNASALLPIAHLIIDVSKVQQYERDMMNVELLQSMIEHHPLVDWIVVVDPYPNAIVRFVGFTLKSLMKFRYHVARTQDDAVAFITLRIKRSSEP